MADRRLSLCREKSGMQPEPDEDNYEKADAETMKAREWDEFVEDNPRFCLCYAGCGFIVTNYSVKRFRKYTKSWLSKKSCCFARLCNARLPAPGSTLELFLYRTLPYLGSWGFLLTNAMIHTVSGLCPGVISGHMIFYFHSIA